MRRVLLIGVASLGLAHLLVALPAGLARLVFAPGGEAFPSVSNFARVRADLWRGAAPTSLGYRELAAAGADTVVDLRAERDAWQGQQKADAVGLEVVPVPIRDGQVPTPMQKALIAGNVDRPGAVTFVHCGAGVGRTGSVVAALEVAGGCSRATALRNVLTFGPLSLEQQVFVATQPSGPSDPVRLVVAVVSRIIDSPRRIWARLRMMPASARQVSSPAD